jgi:hypothetical protein
VDKKLGSRVVPLLARREGPPLLIGHAGPPAPTAGAVLGENLGIIGGQTGRFCLAGLDRLWITRCRPVPCSFGNRSPPPTRQVVAGAAEQASDLNRKRWLSC